MKRLLEMGIWDRGECEEKAESGLLFMEAKSMHCQKRETKL
jgi:hypothetical protein